MKDENGELLFNQAHTVMLIATIDCIKTFVDNANNSKKCFNKNPFQQKNVPTVGF